MDGITATSLLYSFLHDVHARVSFYIPDRATEGYGLKPAHIASCALARKIDLIITVDCGVSSHQAILEAGRHGIDVIVTDHHEMPDAMPEALAVINPKRKDAATGLQNLAGVGVAFYLIISLRMQLRKAGFWHDGHEPNLKSYCDLVALGTVADVVPMVNENRILTRAGLSILRTQGNAGIQVLMETCGIDRRYLDSTDIAFRLAPRLNAAGRVAHADAAMTLLHADNPAVAARHAGHLHALNRKRREMEKEIIEEIDAYLDRHPSAAVSPVVLLHGRGWHVGVLGIVASRLVTRLGRPVVVVTLEGDIAKGSARSIPGIDLAALFSACASHLISYGGHAMAAGLQLHVDKIDDFRHSLAQHIGIAAAKGLQAPALRIDAPLNLTDISLTLMNEFDLLKPYGENNQEPLFVAENVRVTSSRVLTGGHRKMVLNQTGSPGFDAIHFNPERHAATLNLFRSVAYRVQINRWNGKENVQLVIEDVLN